MEKTISIRYWIAGILGLCLVIVVHEFGHFSACKLFNVKTPVFSVGFGPTLASINIGDTAFQLALLPLGGYVSIDPTDFDAQPYLVKLIIMLAGIFFNFLLTGMVLIYLMHVRSAHDSSTQPTRLKKAAHDMGELLTRQGNATGFIGPIGIVSITGKALAVSGDLFLFALAILSANIGAFNLLPIPFFDGGKVVMITFELLTGPVAPEKLHIISLIFLALLILFTILIANKDMRRLRG